MLEEVLYVMNIHILTSFSLTFMKFPGNTLEMLSHFSLLWLVGKDMSTDGLLLFKFLLCVVAWAVRIKICF